MLHPTARSRPPRVTAVVLNWNGYEDTRSCVESLLSCGYENIEVIVVDNASADGSGARLAAEAEGYRVILHSKNDGFARGCNVGIRDALRDPECHYVLLINNDAVLDAGSLGHAVRRAEAVPRVGLVGGRIIIERPSGATWPSVGGGRVDMLRGQADCWAIDAHNEERYTTGCRLGFVTCALALVSRCVLETVGLLPEEYFFGQEEWDFSVATARAGFELWYEPKFGCCHRCDGAHSNSDPKFVYNSYRNKLIFQRKYLHPLLWPIWFFVFEQVYGRLLAPRSLARLHGASSKSTVLVYALRTAIRDHKRDGVRRIEESDMVRFAEELEAARARP